MEGCTRIVCIRTFWLSLKSKAFESIWALIKSGFNMKSKRLISPKALAFALIRAINPAKILWIVFVELSFNRLIKPSMSGVQADLSTSLGVAIRWINSLNLTRVCEFAHVSVNRNVFNLKRETWTARRALANRRTKFKFCGPLMVHKQFVALAPRILLHFTETAPVRGRAAICLEA